MEENTQDTSNDTLSTIADLELEGDTMDTQVTAATELSQITRPSSLSVSQAIFRRLFKRLNRGRTRKPYAYACASPCLGSKQTKPTYRCRCCAYLVPIHLVNPLL